MHGPGVEPSSIDLNAARASRAGCWMVFVTLLRDDESEDPRMADDHTVGDGQREERMRAIVITGVGGTEVLEVREVPTPEPAGDQVRVRVRAAGVNRAD